MEETSPLDNVKPTLVVLAAGMGSRYGGLKQVDPMGPSGESILDYSVFDAVRAGFGKVVFVIREDIEQEFRDQIGSRFPESLPVEYAFQRMDDVPVGYSVPEGRTKPWGTAHAVYAARHVVNEPFAAINADDFYGREAYETLAGFLSNPELGKAECRNCMVGFRLKNTLSAHGSVARGICALDESGMLVSIEELTDIYQAEGQNGENRPQGGEPRPLPGATLASMNMWGFSETIFAAMEEEFGIFLKQHGDEPNSEFYITTFMDTLIKDGREKVRVLDTNSDWFGVTYQEDKPIVVQSIAQLVESGAYPSSLW
ncbi:MAG: nucleotidyltransferase [Verrucomicrobiae bacterium]|nr:nucleotidyltransferase [Verrucomicrobiae bacterium]